MVISVKCEVNVTKEDYSPIVSVIIPTYNREGLIGRAVKSVLNQTFKNFEIIVVDDASSDGTERVIKSFGDSRIRYVRHSKNKGISEARNTGIKIAAGRFIAFQDSDDEWLPTKLAKQIALMQNSSHSVGVVYTAFWKIKKERRIYIPFSWVNQKEGDIHKELLKGNFIGTPVVLARKECFEKADLFDKNIPVLDDWEMWIRISNYFHFKYIDEPLVNAYYRSDNISSNPDYLICALKLILQKHFNKFVNDKKSLSTHYNYLSRLLIENGEIRKGKLYLTKSREAYLGRIRSRLCYKTVKLCLQMKDWILPHASIRKKFAKGLYFLFFDWKEFRRRLKTIFGTLRRSGIKNIPVNLKNKGQQNSPFPFPESALAHKYCIGKGLEIGGSAHNPFGLNTLNVDITDSMDTEFKKEEIRNCGKALKVDIVANGDDIPLPNESQDFIVSSHVIEHFPNPIKALIEWDRLVKPGGIIFMIIPHKERTFDKGKKCTPLTHLIKDFENNNTQLHDDHNGHDHCWITETFVEVIEYMIKELGMKWKIAKVQDVDDKVGNGFTVVIRKLKTQDSLTVG